VCPNHRKHLHDPELRGPWAGGRAAVADPELIERTVTYLAAHPPAGNGTCSVCRP
jgi:hypothetical protein